MLLIDLLIAGSHCDNLFKIFKKIFTHFFVFLKEKKKIVQVFLWAISSPKYFVKDYCKIRCFGVDALACPKKLSLNTIYMFLYSCKRPYQYLLKPDVSSSEDITVQTRCFWLLGRCDKYAVWFSWQGCLYCDFSNVVSGHTLLQSFS